jgi:hypothetical protein
LNVYTNNKGANTDKTTEIILTLIGTTDI